MQKRRVVVTGLGAVTPIGKDVNEAWENAIKGVSGVGPLTRVDSEKFPAKVAAEINDFQPEDYMDKKEARKMDRFTQYAIAASLMAVKDANLTITEEIAPRVGVWVGSGIGGMETFEQQYKTFLEKGARRVSPFFVPMMIPDMATGQISIALGAKGVNSCTVTACATGTNSIGDAFKVIQRGDADVMISGGTEAPLTEMSFAGFSSAKALSLNPDPKTASRPFDLNRDGFVMGEGAGILVLEDLEHALARGARIYAEIVGYGATGDAHHITAPAPGGARRWGARGRGPGGFRGLRLPPWRRGSRGCSSHGRPPEARFRHFRTPTPRSEGWDHDARARGAGPWLDGTGWRQKNPGTDARPADTRTVLPETATSPHPTTANGSGGSSDPGNRTNTEQTEDKPKIEPVQGGRPVEPVRRKGVERFGRSRWAGVTAPS